MRSFLGEFQHTLDPKGRVILPSTYRADLADGLVMTVWLDHCLAVHPLEDWTRVLEGLRALRTTDRRERMFARMMLSHARFEELDKQGRVTIPPSLREYAGLTKDVVVVGNDSRIELWDGDRWDAYSAEGMADFADTEQSFGAGIF
jgi:MraZ protein